MEQQKKKQPYCRPATLSPLTHLHGSEVNTRLRQKTLRENNMSFWYSRFRPKRQEIRWVRCGVENVACRRLPADPGAVSPGARRWCKTWKATQRLICATVPHRTSQCPRRAPQRSVRLGFRKKYLTVQKLFQYVSSRSQVVFFLRQPSKICLFGYKPQRAGAQR